MMRRQPGRWILGGVLTICLLVAAVLSLTYTAFTQLEANRALARQANEELLVIRQLFGALQDAETGQRGYLLAQDPAYLAPYTASVGRITELRARLQTFADDNPLLRERIRALFEQIDAKQAELESAIEISTTQGFEAARARILDDQGKQAMDAIRSMIDDMVEQAEAETRASRERLDTSVNRTRFMALLAGSLSVLIAAGGGVMLWRSFRKLKAAEASLKEQASLLQTTLDNTSEGVAAFDPVKGLIAWNSRFFDFAGYPEDFPRFGRPFSEFFDFDQRRADRMFDLGGDGSGVAGLDQMSKLMPRTRIAGRELECTHRRTQTGGIVMTCSDVTERMRMEQVARQSQKMEAIGHLTGGVAHDFNNLLQVISSNLDLMNRHLAEPEQLALHIKHASTAAERGARLTRQLLAFARRQPLEPAVVNLGKRVRAMSDLLHRTLGETIEIETIVDAGLWNTFVDVNQMENAVLNLAVNARDAMPGGGKLTIELANTVLDESYARLHDEVSPGQYVMLAVTDTGMGMPAEVAARAFEPFFTTKPEGQGTGLGLSMVYGFVKQSNGHAKVYSEIGLGTTIKLYLPRSRRPEEALVPIEAQPVRGANERILLVEDDEDVRRAVAEMTRGLGYQVIEARDGEDALALLRNGIEVDLLFTDVVMSGAVSGRTLARSAQQIIPEIAVLFTSGYTENAIIHHGRLDEGVHLLSKPYREPELGAKLRAVLDERHARRATMEPAGGPPGARPEQAPTNDGERGSLSVLLVDDDALIRISTAEMLRDLGHRVTDVARGDEALAVLAQNGDIDVLVVDLALPDMNGAEMVAKASASHDALRVVFASGHSSHAVKLDAENVRFAFLPKPYDIGQLADALAKLH